MLNPDDRLSDSGNPLVRDKAAELTAASPTPMAKVEAIFGFVRDGIQFGFPTAWDRVKASTTLDVGLGYCNSKATLFHALCQAAGVSSRLHTGLIDIQIMRGIFPSFAFPFLPAAGGHTWMEVEVDGEWQPIDSYINDAPLYRQAVRRLTETGRTTGFSLSMATGPTSSEFNFGDRGFVHMGAVIEDHGTWDDFAAYMASDRYVPLRGWQRSLYPMLAKLSNRNIDRIRRS
jgi:transglutaminase-like putative cysteine protease